MSALSSQDRRVADVSGLADLELSKGNVHLLVYLDVDMRLDDVTERAFEPCLEQPCLFVEPVFRNNADHFCQTHHSLPVVSYLAFHRARLMGEVQPEIVTGLGISTGAGT